LKEAQKQGFKLALVPKENAPRKPLQGLDVVPVARVGEALELAFKSSGSS
jgi:DNA repair protein RadA/Sms